MEKLIYHTLLIFQFSILKFYSFSFILTYYTLIYMSILFLFRLSVYFVHLKLSLSFFGCEHCGVRLVGFRLLNNFSPLRSLISKPTLSSNSPLPQIILHILRPFLLRLSLILSGFPLFYAFRSSSFRIHTYYAMLRLFTNLTMLG